VFNIVVDVFTIHYLILLEFLEVSCHCGVGILWKLW